jgi:hypothetical protein
MTQIPDLEIELERSGAETFAVSLRLARPDSDADVSRREDGLRFAIAELNGLRTDAAAYGRRLGQDFFAAPSVREVFTAVQALDGPLRVRLAIAANAHELNALHWEALADPASPEPAAPLFLNDRIRFSRFVDSPDWRRAAKRAKSDMCALVVVANPNDLNRFTPGGQALAPVNVAEEVQRAKTGLEGVELKVLGETERASLANIVDRLLGAPDILYLVCHGALIDDKPQLFLENDTGAADVVEGAQLVAKLSGLQQPPRLVVLVSCQSAGNAESDALNALGPTLGEAGVPAVLAMHGNVRMATIDTFMPVFFRELQRDGEIDRAVAIARGATQEHKDHWAPILYMRLKSGGLWYDRGFSSDASGRPYEKWPALVNSIRDGKCTPILGPGLADSLVGSRRETALRLAKAHRFPMAPHEQEDLPQVAQYVAQNQDRSTLFRELRESFRGELLSRLGEELAPELKESPADTLVVELGKRRWESDDAEPHRVLANLPLRIYVTTALDGLLAEALLAAGKEPRVELLRWNEYADWPDSVYDSEPDYEPSPEKPLVYHLFGRLGVEDSMVITEDDYFDFLINVTRDPKLIPGAVQRAFVDGALLFLGFAMDGWDFRVLFRGLMDQEGRSRRGNYAHAGVQINPEEGRILEIDGARRYLESYFENADIHIYWGGPEDFAHDLRRQPELPT